MRSILAGAMLLLLAGPADTTKVWAQVMCNQLGNTTLCSNGASATQLGSTTFYNPPPAPPMNMQPPPISQTYGNGQQQFGNQIYQMPYGGVRRNCGSNLGC